LTILDFGAQLEAFLQKCPFASASIIAKHFLVNPHTMNEILQRELRMRTFSRHWVPHSFTSAQKVARVDASIEMLRILQESEANDFLGITTGDESWFQCIYPSSEMFARSPADVILWTRQAIGANKIMITLFFTTRTRIVLDVIPKGWKYNQRYLVDNVVPGLKRGKMSFARRKPGSSFLGAHRQFNVP
jgi:hypothetical protein